MPTDLSTKISMCQYPNRYPPRRQDATEIFSTPVRERIYMRGRLMAVEVASLSFDDEADVPASFVESPIPQITGLSGTETVIGIPAAVRFTCPPV